MVLDIPTIAMCSTSAAVILCIAMLVSWFKDGRPRNSFWLFAPFALAIPAGFLLAYPDYFGGTFPIAVGWFLLTLVYAAGWQGALYVSRGKPRPIAAFLACFACFIFSLTLGADGAHPEWRMVPRTALMAVFCLLAARDFHRLQNTHMPSAQTLAWLYACFGIFHAVRTPLALFLPAPFGPGEPQIWAIALFNFLLVLHGLLLGLFMTTLGGERIAMHHFHLAMIDPLTGAGNRRALDRRLARLHDGDDTAKNHASDTDEMVTALAILDIDRFKTVNDRFGHSFGDIVIAGAANIACEMVGHRNVFRLGGEEFAVLITAKCACAAEQIADQIRNRFATHAHVAQGISHCATLSIGLAVCHPQSTPDSLYKEADCALYLAKALGRNRTVLADEKTLSRMMEEALDEMVPPRTASPEETSTVVVALADKRRSLRRA